MANRIFNMRTYKARRQRLRREMTPQERMLWEKLRGRALDGLKFRTMTGVAHYIPDFFCFEKMLAIEVDGHQHETTIGKGNDGVRDESLESLAITTLRFSNDRIETELANVVAEIRAQAARLPSVRPRGRRRQAS